VIPESIPINDDNLMPILICAQHIESLTIEFAKDSEQEKESHDLLLSSMMRRYGALETETETEPEPDNEKKDKAHKVKKIKFPALSINPSCLPHLKNLRKIDVKSCGVHSSDTFVSGLILQLSGFMKLRTLALPQLLGLRHHSIRRLDIHQLQIGFDGMNIHLGAELIGITHFKRQLPSIETVCCDELYLFIGQDIYREHEKSGKQYWFMMRKYANDTNIKVVFRNPSITIMLMPHDKSVPPLINEQWSEIQEWTQDRLGTFIQNVSDLPANSTCND